MLVWLLMVDAKVNRVRVHGDSVKVAKVIQRELGGGKAGVGGRGRRFGFVPLAGDGVLTLPNRGGNV